MTDTGLYMAGYRQGQFDARHEVLEAKAELAALKRALADIARLHTDLSGDFSMGSKQSSIAREALSALDNGE